MLCKFKKDGVYKDPGNIIPMANDKAKELINANLAEKVNNHTPEYEVDKSDDLTDNEFDEVLSNLVKVDGINDQIGSALIDAGYDIESIAESDPETLSSEVSGIGKRNAPRIIKGASKFNYKEV